MEDVVVTVKKKQKKQKKSKKQNPKEQQQQQQQHNIPPRSSTVIGSRTSAEIMKPLLSFSATSNKKKGYFQGMIDKKPVHIRFEENLVLSDDDDKVGKDNSVSKEKKDQEEISYNNNDNYEKGSKTKVQDEISDNNNNYEKDNKTKDQNGIGDSNKNNTIANNNNNNNNNNNKNKKNKKNKNKSKNNNNDNILKLPSYSSLSKAALTARWLDGIPAGPPIVDDLPPSRVIITRVDLDTTVNSQNKKGEKRKKAAKGIQQHDNYQINQNEHQAEIDDDDDDEYYYRNQVKNAKRSRFHQDDNYNGEEDGEEIQEDKQQLIVDYEKLEVYESRPNIGDNIAYKVIELSDNYTPGLSKYKEATIIGYEPITNQVTLTSSSTKPNQELKKDFNFINNNEFGKFSLCDLGDEYILDSQIEPPKIFTIKWEELHDVRKIIK